MHKQYKIQNMTTNVVETPWAENEQMLIQLYKSVGEDIQIMEILQDGVEESDYRPAPMTNINDIDSKHALNPDDLIVEQQNEDINGDSTERHIQFTPNLPDQLFEVDGKQLKLSGGVLYNKIWMDVDMTEFRIISQKTDKIITNEFKTLQQLQWSPVVNSGGE